MSFRRLLCASALFALALKANFVSGQDPEDSTSTTAEGVEGGDVASASSLFGSRRTTYVVVGGGTAGLAVATRLSEDPSNIIYVLEAGADGFNNPNIANLSGPSIQALPGSSVDWNYTSLPLQYAAGQTIAMTRGRVLGGSSAVNGALFTRPNRIDLDLWQTAFGAIGWTWNTISAAIKKAEKFSTTPGLPSIPSYHGQSGPICDTQRPLVGEVWNKGVIPAVVACGGKESQDQNGGDPSGIWYAPKAMFQNSTRSYSANSYYLPNAGRSNLHVLTTSTVSRILWSSKKQGGKVVATGVEYINGSTGNKVTLSADRVVLSGGVFGTPQVLELSGVGNPKIMNPLGISTVVNLPAVGENLMEQPTARYLAALAPGLNNAGLQLTLNFETPRTLLTPSEWITARNLLNTAPPGLSKSAHNALKLMFDSDAVIIEFMGFPNPSNLVFLPILMHPMSRGYSHIVSADARVAPAFDLALLESPFDLYILTKALARARRFAAQSSLTPFLASTPPSADGGAVPAGELAPGANITTDAQLQQFIKQNVGVAYHPLGTAALGSVVNPTLKVKGTSNVFVVDGSIIPIEPSAHPSSIIYGIGEMAATILNSPFSLLSTDDTNDSITADDQ
ncbi:L-sorbose 1-dehydrogenase [Favolaschia claudopus]|uniref:L-sorbose 1-dehydrogenase n=1 Tax=Favolaschia claudopus TaxID=2862362 RepID=A0AAV9ZAJ3_9AGAR